ncbi:hypothetical protein ES703_28518 [subsurface metagenome]
MDHDNVLIHVIEHDIISILDILYEHSKTGKWSDVLNINKYLFNNLGYPQIFQQKTVKPYKHSIINIISCQTATA